MVLAYSHLSPQMEGFNLIIKQLQNQCGLIEEAFSSFRSPLSNITDPQAQADLQRIEKAIAKIKTILDHYADSDSAQTLMDREHIREVRHDLRAAVGGVMGYTELLQDFLRDEGLNEALALSGQFYGVAQNTLGIIEHLSLEDEGLFEPEGAEYLGDQVVGHVLIVDDSPEKQEQLSRRLSVVGHQISIVDSGPAALEFLKKNEVDIILLDLLMPGMNGDDVLRVLKGNDALKDIPVLVVSSASDTNSVVECIRLGADDYLPMPLNNTLLYARMNACLTRKMARDREQETLKLLDASQQQLSTAIENIDEGFAVFDVNGLLTTYNSKFAHFYPIVEKYSKGTLSYKTLIQESIKSNIYQFNKHDSCSIAPPLPSSEEAQRFLKGYFAFHDNPTRPRVDYLTMGIWVEVIENQIPGGGTVAIHKDISVIKQNEAALHYTAMHDALTGLANRKNFDNALEVLSKKSKETHQKFAIMFFDLDGFKNINDTLGHDFGDLVLQTVGRQLKASVRDTDLVARFGGDEFAALIVNVPSMGECEVIAQRCLDTIGTQVEQGGKVAKFGVSIGIAYYPDHAIHTVELLKKADEAMYVAKKSGKGTYRLAS